MCISFWRARQLPVNVIVLHLRQGWHKERMTDRKVFENSISRFISWLDRNGTAGYDPYDLWSTKYGIRARRMFYRYGKLAAPLVRRWFWLIV